MCFYKCLGIVALVFVVSTTASADTLIVDAQANIFGAGHSAVPGDGVMPPGAALPSGTNRVLTFSSIVGRWSPSNSLSSDCGPDGTHFSVFAAGTDVYSSDGISGVIRTDAEMFLVGAFLSDLEPQSPGPARLDFSPAAIGTEFLTLTPQLNQVFFIGDGLTGTDSGTVQRFSIPNSATHLYLGVADAYYMQGMPGYYGDNYGTLATTFSVVPEPSTFALLGSSAFGLLVFVGRRRRAA
jgi:hypothetical protein